MDKKQLHRLWRKIRPIKVWYLVVLALVAVSVSVLSLRQNNLGMVRLRNAVYQADQNNGNVEAALQALRAYVYAHMNTDLATGNDSVYPPIQLKYTYERLQAAAQAQAQAAGGKVYTDAQAYCEQQDSVDFSGRNREPCIEQYVSSHPTSVARVPDALYKFDFASPSWSPDFAGFSLIVSSLLVLALACRVAAGQLAKRFL